MKIITLVTGMAAAGAIGVGGTYWTVQSRIEREAAQMEAQHAATVAGLRADLARLRAEFAEVKTAATAREVDASLAELRALVRAAQQKLVTSMDKLLQLTDGKLASGVTTLFALNATEQGAMESALSTAAAELSRLMGENIDEVDRTTPARLPGSSTPVSGALPGGVAFKVKAFPAAGGKVREKLVGSLRAALGTERFEALMILMADRFDLAVGHGFGTVPHTLRIDRLLAPGPGKSYLILNTTQWKRPVPGSSGSESRTATNFERSTVDQAKLERDYPAFAKLLPADF